MAKGCRYCGDPNGGCNDIEAETCYNLEEEEVSVVQIKTDLKITPEMELMGHKIYSSQEGIRKRIVEEEEKFYRKVAKECLGRELDVEKDRGRFQLYQDISKRVLGKDVKSLAFDGTVVGEVIIDYINLKWEFIPVNQNG